MKTKFIFTLLFALFGLNSAIAANNITGNGSQGTVAVVDFNDQNLTKIPASSEWVLTLDVENPNGVSFNQWGTSLLAIGDNAFPEKNSYTGLQLYLQSATNGGGKLNAVFDGDDHEIDNVTYQGNFSVTITYNGEYNLKIETTNASGNKATNEYTLSTALPEIAQFAYGLPTGINVNNLHIDIIEEVAEVYYTLSIDAPAGKEVTVTYDGESVTNGATFNKNTFDNNLLVAGDIDGYTWSVVIDNDAKIVTLQYKEVTVQNNPQSVVDLVNRIGGKGTADKFHFILDSTIGNSEQEMFVIDGEDKKIVIKGNSISAITAGLGWYLNNYANVNIAWNVLNEKSVDEAYANLTNLPLPSAEEVRTCDAKYRYFFNYCTFGYSMTSWTWKRWQQEIDWMALHGINMPLQIIGLEEVWRMFLTIEENGERKYKYTDTEAKAFVAGPAFTAWWGMNNLEGWGGTASGMLNNGTWEGAGGVQDDAWYTRQITLARNILARQRELGMQPVLPGFSGMVPSNFTTKTGVATDANGGKWAGGFQRPRIIDPTATRFAEIAADYYNCLKTVMGESQYYSMDPFHEGGSISSGKYTEAYKAVYDAMEAAKSGSQWVIQQWQWDGNQRKSISAVPAGRLVVLDLFSDGKPQFDAYNGYAPQDAVFCAIPNFGGRSGLMGRLNNLADNYFAYKAKYASIKGIGAAPEAIEQTPVTYDLIFQLPWMGTKPNMAEWVKQYATARYGTSNSVAEEAWDLLRQGPLNYGADAIQGPVEDVWAARPNLDAKPASSWGVTINTAGSTYTKARRQMLIDATFKLLSQNSALALEPGSIYESNYNYDLVELGGAVMADYAYDLLTGIKTAKNNAGTAYNDDATYIARRDAFLALIADVDAFKGTNLNFRLGKWTQEARDAAGEVENATTATPDWYEFNNARTLVSTWSSPNTNLNDYSYRSWQGLMKDLYLPRWKYYFEHNCTGTEYGYFEWNWAHGMEHYVGQTSKSTTPLTEGEAGYRYSREPEGNTVQSATALLAKYIIPVRMADGMYYAYRYLSNDLASKISIVAEAGATIDLTEYFGQLTGVTVSGDFISGDATDLSKITIKSDATDGSHTGTITMSDGTILTFAVIINPAYNGAYYINYQHNGDAPLFVAYNEDVDNSRNKGYKLIATGTYNTDAVADKIFTITPTGDGYTISAQGKYLKQPTLAGWNHVMFSDDKGDAGVYLFEETSGDLFKIRCTANGINYLNDYDNLVFGNDNSNKEALSTFKIVPATTYPITMPECGATALCLPFNITLPEGVAVYDITSSNIVDNEGNYTYALTPLAVSGETVKSGTPVIVKAAPGNYELVITTYNNNAKTSLSGSLLEGNFVKQEIVSSADVNSYYLDGTTFKLVETSQNIAANSCWLETGYLTNSIEYSVDTAIENIVEEQHSNGTVYDLFGRRVNIPTQGIFIVDGKKKVIR